MYGSGFDRLLAAAFLASFVMLAFEVLTYRQLTFVANALQTSTIISIAIMGIAGGAWLFHLTRYWPVAEATRRAAWALAVSVIVSFAAFAYLGEHLPKAVPLLCSPFIAGGYIISLSFAHRRVGMAYLVDLSGGALAIPAVVALLPLVREEGAQFFLAATALTVPVIAGSERRSRRIVALTGAVALLVAGAVNASKDFYNLARDGVATNQSDNRVLNRAKLPNRTLVASKSTTAGRTDVIQVAGADGNWGALFENGRQIDFMRRHSADRYIWDPRVPRGVMAPSPRVLVIGTAGEGILKTLNALGAHTDGVELNGGVYDLLSGRLAPLCGHCYDGVNVSITDGRTYLERSDQRYDMITLLNAHVVKGYQNPAMPEFIHTKEAIDLYFDRLRDGGFVNWEERQSGAADSRAGRPAFRVVATASAVLRDRGVTEPGRHIVAFRWRARGNYDQILVRREPWDAESLAAVRTWLDRVLDARGGENAPFSTSVIRPLWFPDEQLSTPLADFVREGDPPAYQAPLAVVPLTDDRPFTFHYRPQDKRIWRAFLWVMLAAVPLVLLPAAALLTRKQGRAVAGRLAFPFLIAGMLGVAYLLIEIVLMQHLQIFLGSPSATFCAVLAGMLAFSGIGGFVGLATRREIRAGLLVALPISLALLAAALPALTRVALPWPLASRVILVLVLIGTPAFLMGVPLPSLLEGVRAKVGAHFVPLVFAFNAGFAALGTTLSFLVSTEYGFSATYWFACGIYIALVAPVIVLDHPRRGVADL